MSYAVKTVCEQHDIELGGYYRLLGEGQFWQCVARDENRTSFSFRKVSPPGAGLLTLNWPFDLCPVPRWKVLARKFTDNL